MPIDWGILSSPQQGQPGGPSTAQPVAAPSPQQGSGSEGSGGLLGGLKGLFGSNPVSTANGALNQQMQNTPAPILAQTLMGSNSQQAPQQPAQPNAQTLGSNPALGLLHDSLPQGQSNNPISLSNIQEMAKKAWPNNQVMQQVAVAQAAHESNLLNKPSQLATQQNNLFGMTGQGNAGSIKKTGNLDTKAQEFASYKSPQDSMNAYASLMNNPRYAGVVSAKTTAEAFNQLQKAGYATDPKYAANLQNVNTRVGQMNSIHSATKAASMPGANAFDVAQSYAGIGRNNHPEVLGNFFQKSLGQKVDPMTTPYCAAFANSVLQSTGHGGTGSLAARSFLNYGTPTNTPSQGDVVVLNRGNDGVHGHVGFYAGEGSSPGTIKILGGNQDGEVKVKEYDSSKVLGYRIPPTAQELQQKSQDMRYSRNP